MFLFFLLVSCCFFSFPFVSFLFVSFRFFSLLKQEKSVNLRKTCTTMPSLGMLALSTERETATRCYFLVTVETVKLADVI